MIYCGNNANHPTLLNGQSRVGTRYECLQKGKQIGLAQPVDLQFAQPYQPIDQLRKYCGTSNNLPPNYNRFGTLHECLLSGIGVGKRQKANQGQNIGNQQPNIIQNQVEIIPPQPNLNEYNNIAPQIGQNSIIVNNPAQYAIQYNRSRVRYKIVISVLLFLILFLAFFMGFYFGKPSIITKFNQDTKQYEIDWNKFIPYIIIFCLASAILSYFLITRI